MVVLALETVTRPGSVAILRDGTARGATGDPGRTHGERLPRELLDLLASEGLRVADVDVLAVVSGPGSFTGLRVGLATVQGLALAAARRVVTVPTLEAMVAAWRGGRDPSAPIVAPCLDGQRGDVFFAAYSQSGTDPVASLPWPALLAPAVGRPDEAVVSIAAHTAGQPVALVGTGAERYAAMLLTIPESRVEPLAEPLAVAAARLAAERADQAVPPHAVHATYIRRPDAVIARERQRHADEPGQADLHALIVELARGQADLAAIQSLQRGAFATVWRADAFGDGTAPGDVARVYVARTGSGEVVAYCACWLVVNELHINSLAVAESWRRRGVATLLLETVSREARALGATSATLEVRESNRAARELYERLGFRVEGVRRDYYEAPREDAIILWNRVL